MAELLTGIDKQQIPAVSRVSFTSDKDYIACAIMPELSTLLREYASSLEANKTPISPEYLQKLDFTLTAIYGGGYLQDVLSTPDKIRLNIYRDQATSEIAGYGFIVSNEDNDGSPQVKFTFFGLTHIKYRRQGIGNLLLISQLGYLKEIGITEYETNLSQHSQRTYARLGVGYTVVGHDQNDPKVVKTRVKLEEIDLQELLPRVELLEVASQK